jgi:MOSC domain-containing protein YiiM
LNVSRWAIKEKVMPTVAAIYTSEKVGQPMRSVDSVETIAGKGIKGDRKFRDGKGGPKDEPGRELTLIESESIEAVNRDYPLKIEVHETRRNIVTRGVALNHLVGKEFTVGSVRLKGIRLCEPCGHLEEITRKGVMRALLHRGGLRAQILEGGPINVGDAVEVVA